MGRRPARSGIVSGLSSFLHAFDEVPSKNVETKTVHSVNLAAPGPSTIRQKRAAPSTTDIPTAKRRKEAEETYVDSARRRFDASILAPRYTDASQVPEHLQKYYAQRHRYFSKYDEGCLLDETGWFSVTPELVAQQIAERCRCGTVLDAFCGVGGNAIAFAQTCERVIAMDTDETRLALARHNAEVYGVADRIEFVLGDYMEFARAYAARPHQGRNIEVVFLSPPWGGPSYLAGDDTAGKNQEEGKHPVFSLSSVQPVHGKELFELSRSITKNVAYYLPRNTSLEEIAQLLPRGAYEERAGEHVEVEEEWMGNKLKALTVYFGGLVEGQEGMF